MDIIDPEGGLVHIAGLAPARALIHRIRRDGDVALLSQTLGIQTGDLFFDTAVGVGNHDGRILLAYVITRRGIDVGRNIDAIELVCDRMNVDLAFDIFGNRAFIGQSEGVLFIICCHRCSC